MPQTAESAYPQPEISFNASYSDFLQTIGEMKDWEFPVSTSLEPSVHDAMHGQPSLQTFYQQPQHPSEYYTDFPPITIPADATPWNQGYDHAPTSNTQPTASNLHNAADVAGVLANTTNAQSQMSSYGTYSNASKLFAPKVNFNTSGSAMKENAAGYLPAIHSNDPTTCFPSADIPNSLLKPMEAINNTCSMQGTNAPVTLVANGPVLPQVTNTSSVPEKLPKWLRACQKHLRSTYPASEVREENIQMMELWTELEKLFDDLVSYRLHLLYMGYQLSHAFHP
jgi:hypothetical protein